MVFWCHFATGAVNLRRISKTDENTLKIGPFRRFLRQKIGELWKKLSFAQKCAGWRDRTSLSGPGKQAHNARTREVFGGLQNYDFSKMGIWALRIAQNTHYLGSFSKF